MTSGYVGPNTLCGGGGAGGGGEVGKGRESGVSPFGKGLCYIFMRQIAQEMACYCRCVKKLVYFRNWSSTIS